MARQAVLGGDLGGRGLFVGSRSKPEWAGIIICVILAFTAITATRFEWYGVLVALFFVVSGIGLFSPWAVFGDRSYAALRVERAHTRYRNAKGTSSYLNEETGDPDWIPERTLRRMEKERSRGERKPSFRPPNAPLAVGMVRWFSIPTGPGSSVVIFRDSTRKKTGYVVIVETASGTRGITDEEGYDAPYLAFGNVLKAIAQPDSLITHVQPLTRALPMDATDHIAWMASKVAAGVPQILVDSYAEVTEMVKTESEQHRSYYALLIPESKKLMKKAARYGGGDYGLGRAVLGEVQSFAAKASRGGKSGIRALGQNHAAALFRSLQDPRFDIDDLEGVNLSNCWQTFNGAESDEYIRVNGGPVSKFGFVPKEAYEASALPVQMFQPLVKDVSPSVIRTITFLDELTPAKQARAKARSDVATDRAGAIKADDSGKVTDGTEEVLLAASAQRLEDLKPGKGHHGLGYGMYVSVTADTPEELEEAAESVENTAAECGIDRIQWLDGRHDLAFITTIPLMRGLRR